MRTFFIQLFIIMIKKRRNKGWCANNRLFHVYSLICMLAYLLNLLTPKSAICHSFWQKSIFEGLISLCYNFYSETIFYIEKIKGNIIFFISELLNILFYFCLLIISSSSDPSARSMTKNIWKVCSSSVSTTYLWIFTTFSYFFN